MKGKLEHFPFPDLLQIMEMLHKNGTLVLSRLGEALYFLFRNGQIVGVDSLPAGREDRRLGELLIKQGKLRPEQLRMALEIQQETKQKLGEILVAEKFCHAESVRHFLEVQAVRIAFQALNWTGGYYRFYPGQVPPSEQTVLEPIQPKAILLSGTRLVDELPVLQEIIPDAGSIYGPVDMQADSELLSSPGQAILEISGIGLTRRDVEVLQKLDGQRSIREMVEVCGVDEVDLYRSLVNLQNMGMITLKGNKQDQSGSPQIPAVTGGRRPGGPFWCGGNDSTHPRCQALLEEFLTAQAFLQGACVFNSAGFIEAAAETGVLPPETLAGLVTTTSFLLADHPRPAMQRLMVEDGGGTVVVSHIVQDCYLLLVADKVASLGAVSRIATLMVQQFEKMVRELLPVQEGRKNGSVTQCTE